MEKEANGRPLWRNQTFLPDPPAAPAAGEAANMQGEAAAQEANAEPDQVRTCLNVTGTRHRLRLPAAECLHAIASVHLLSLALLYSSLRSGLHRFHPSTTLRRPWMGDEQICFKACCVRHRMNEFRPSESQVVVAADQPTVVEDGAGGAAAAGERAGGAAPHGSAAAPQVRLATLTWSHQRSAVCKPSGRGEIAYFACPVGSMRGAVACLLCFSSILNLSLASPAAHPAWRQGCWITRVCPCSGSLAAAPLGSGRRARRRPAPAWRRRLALRLAPSCGRRFRNTRIGLCASILRKGLSACLLSCCSYRTAATALVANHAEESAGVRPCAIGLRTWMIALPRHLVAAHALRMGSLLLRQGRVMSAGAVQVSDLRTAAKPSEDAVPVKFISPEAEVCSTAL